MRQPVMLPNNRVESDLGDAARPSAAHAER
jgi:hypothetical protein